MPERRFLVEYWYGEGRAEDGAEPTGSKLFMASDTFIEVAKWIEERERDSLLVTFIVQEIEV